MQRKVLSCMGVGNCKFGCGLTAANVVDNPER